jgi:hypothetical protein
MTMRVTGEPEVVPLAEAPAAAGAELAGAGELEPELELQAVATPATSSDTAIAETRLVLLIRTTLSGIAELAEREAEHSERLSLSP